MTTATAVERGLKTSEMRDVSETWGERGKERKCQRGKWQRLKEKMGGKRRGMERKCESQWGWMVEEAGGRVKTRWKERKGDEQDSHHSCFLFQFLLAALHIYLQSWMRADWLTTTDPFDPGGCEARSSAGDVCMKSGHVRWCMVIRPEQSRVRRQSSSAPPARAGAKDSPPVHDESLFRSDWRQRRELQIHIWSLHSGKDPKQPVKQRLLSWEDTQSIIYLHKIHLQYYSLELIINHWWIITDLEKCNNSLCLGTIFTCKIVLLWSCARCSKTFHGSIHLLQASLFFRRPTRNFQVSLEVKM